MKFLTVKSAKLPKSFSLTGWVSFAVGNGSHYEAAEFRSSTPGHSSAYFAYVQHGPGEPLGRVAQIGFAAYHEFIRSYLLPRSSRTRDLT